MPRHDTFSDRYSRASDYAYAPGHYAVVDDYGMVLAIGTADQVLAWIDGAYEFPGGNPDYDHTRGCDVVDATPDHYAQMNQFMRDVRAEAAYESRYG